MTCPRCGMPMRDGVRHGVIPSSRNANYGPGRHEKGRGSVRDGIRPPRGGGEIFVCSDGCWYELEKVRCEVCPNYLGRMQQNRRGRFCSKPCSDGASRGRPKPRRAGLP